MKHTFIINGRGGVGKDTVCKLTEAFWRVQNISSIDPIVEIATELGWDGQKAPESRRFLSDLKQAFIRYNDLPFRYCMEKYDAFMSSDDEILFVHIREPDEIDRFKKAVGENCHTILIRRPEYENKVGEFGNSADDSVDNYPYDGILVLNKPEREMPEQVYQFLKGVIA